ncbi:winged helix-turn-helix transcriptional regulator [Candidatus Bathyarchaeota archaeon]|nr:winged helix-turn-helix transcriptional regulator [Candidatus Bathyarchaeota archaeon]
MNEKLERFWNVLQKPKTMDILLVIAEGNKKYTEIYNNLIVIGRLITMTTLKSRLDELKEINLIGTQVYDRERNYVKYVVTPLGSFVAEQIRIIYKKVEDRLTAG